MIPYQWPAKDPGETLDYQIDWTNRLTVDGVEDTITGSSWAIISGAGLTIHANTFTTTFTTVWLASGVLGTTYLVTNTVTTASSRVMVQSVQIIVASR